MTDSIYPMRRLCDVGVSLLDCDHRTPLPAPVGFPYIAIPNVRDGRLDLSEVRLISKEDFDSWTRKTKPKAGDIIMTRRARVGDVAVVPDNLVCAIGQNLVILRSDGKQLDQSYLRWVLRGPLYEEQKQKFLNVGAVFDSLNCGDIPKFEIPVPTLPEQRAIAAILGALDDKIELNRRLNRTLEAMARAIFTSWFVDFDPVRAKMEGHPPFGMDADTAAVFPDAFEDSPLGQIPRGWQVKALPDVIQVNPSRSLRNGADAPYLEMSNLPTHAARALRWETRAFTSGMKFINGDALVARITPCLENGKTAFVDFLKDGEVGWGSTEYIVLRGKSPLLPEYAYFLARSDSFRAFAIKNMTGTSGRQRVPTTAFDSYLIVVPPSSIAKQFSGVASPIMVTMYLIKKSRGQVYWGQ